VHLVGIIIRTLVNIPELLRDLNIKLLLSAISSAYLYYVFVVYLTTVSVLLIISSSDCIRLLSNEGK
jgi:hypothetical protein